jgi:hypothetical protein
VSNDASLHLDDVQRDPYRASPGYVVEVVSMSRIIGSSNQDTFGFGSREIKRNTQVSLIWMDRT